MESSSYGLGVQRFRASRVKRFSGLGSDALRVLGSNALRFERFRVSGLHGLKLIGHGLLGGVKAGWAGDWAGPGPGWSSPDKSMGGPICLEHVLDFGYDFGEESVPVKVATEHSLRKTVGSIERS
eukprot:5606922-Amphidinium_carterae.1